MNKQKIKNQKQQRRKRRVRAKVFGTTTRPRLTIFKSLKHIYAQLIDDENKITLLSASDKELAKSNQALVEKNKDQEKNQAKGKIKSAQEVGKLLGQKAVAKNIKTCIFDKSKYKYHGRVKAVADGARESGLNF